jgi:hypothetical protein
MARQRTITGELVRSVFFDETGEEIVVVALCRRCYRDGETLEAADLGIVSPRGTAHHSDGCESTECGIRATGDGWWWSF